MLTSELTYVNIRVNAPRVDPCGGTEAGPYFLLYNVLLISGFVVLLTIFGRGGFLITLEMSRLNYDIYHWIQNIAVNLPHLRAAGQSPYLLKKTDELTRAYVRVRQQRSNLLTGRQYKAAALWQVVGHSGMIATAGMLVSAGQLTVGQFEAAELLAGNLLLNMDTLARRMVHMFFAFVSFREMSAFFSLPQDEPGSKAVIPLDQLGIPVGQPNEKPEEDLYDLLSQSAGELSHSRYGAFLRQMASFADAFRTARRDRG